MLTLKRRKDQMGECDKETSFAILDYFHSQGGNHIGQCPQSRYQDLSHF